MSKKRKEGKGKEMDQYQRIISYVYRYEDGEKKENTGYVRLERRAERVRLTLQLQGGKLQDAAVYTVYESEAASHRERLGLLEQETNGCSFQKELMWSDVAGAIGLLVVKNPDEYYATSWTDQKVDWMGQERRRKEAEPLVEEERQTQKEQLVEEESQVQEEQLVEEESQTQEDNLTERESPADDIEAEEVHTETFDQEGCNCARRMMEEYPEMYPFDLQNMGRCVRIEPKDIGYMPIEYWALAGNQFLLHGYYCYRHLIFGRLRSGVYCLGVPGVYCDREKKQAMQYGMKEFISLVRQRSLQGCFGYWMYPMDFRQRRKR